MDMNMSGLIIETHHIPDEAWSDAKQQITPQRLNEILAELKVRAPKTENQDFNLKLTQLRGQIDEIDERLLNQLSQRLELIKQIGQYKKDNNITILQKDRWFEILENRIKKGTDLGLSDEFVENLLRLIHEDSVRTQTKILNEKSK